jgi:hypothetical protein
MATGISVVVTTTDNGIHVINTASMREDWAVHSLCVTARRDTIVKRTSDNKQPVLEANEHAYLGLNAMQSKNSRQGASSLAFIQSDRQWRCTVKVEPRTGWLVCNGYPGSLQAFNRQINALSQNYAIVDYTRISKKENNSKMFVPSITHSEFIKHPLGKNSITFK